MSRRALAFLVGVVVVAVLLAATELISLPYVVLYPGPVLNTLGTSGGAPVVEVEGRQTYPAAGRLDLVSFYAYGGPGGHLNVLTALGEWLSPGHSVVPQGEYFSAGLTMGPATGPGALSPSENQDVLTAAVLRQLKIPFREAVVITQTVPNSPASGVLRPGDVLAAVDGRPVSSITAAGLIDARRVGQPVMVTVDRRGASRTFRIVTKPGPGGQPAIGVYLAGSFTFPFIVRVNTSSCSGGGCDLMFALALLDKLVPLNLTGGAVVAGAGTVDDTGDIGPVFGINVLLGESRGQGATVFLTPAADCAQALRAAPPGLRLVKVSTLASAVRALGALRAGRPVPSCAG